MRENEAKLCWNETDNFSQQETSGIWHWLNLNRAGGREMDVSLQQTMINALKMSLCVCVCVFSHLNSWDSVTVTTIASFQHLQQTHHLCKQRAESQHTSAWHELLILINYFKTCSNSGLFNEALFRTLWPKVSWQVKIMKTWAIHHSL